MGLIVVPIKQVKLEAWKSWSESLSGDGKQEFDEMNQRFGLSRHDVWFAETPGGPVAVVLHEGTGADSFMQKLAESGNSYDVSFKNCIEEFHGVNFDGSVPGPMPVKMN